MTGNQHDGLPLDDGGEHEDFLSRWSQRKALARQGVELPEPEEHATSEPEAESHQVEAGDVVDDASAEKGEATGVADETPELPAIDSLDEDSDYSPFLATGVAPDVQREALRKLFHSPKFNIRDGLDDYDLDFTNPEPLGDIVTAEMRHRMQVELEKLARLAEEEAAADETVAAVDSDPIDEAEAPEAVAEAEEADVPDEAEESDEHHRAS
jgi:hypothetical protein